MLGTLEIFRVGFLLGIFDGALLGKVLGASVALRGAVGSEDGIMLGT
jgi:hypothetical protein